MPELAHTPKILFVEDDMVVRDVVHELLVLLGYEVVVAGNGEEALDVLSRDRSIDVLFTDIRMPGMNGFTLADFATILRPDLAVLFASGFAEELADARRMPGIKVLSKPYRHHQLRPAIDEVLARAA